MPSFEVEPDDLVAHASHLDGLVHRLETAVSASDTALSTGAYGLLCAFLPPIVNPTGEKARDTLSASVEGVRTSADNVRKTATAYRDGDQANARPFIRRLASDS
ncbi:type VII secretion target [Amycolatopsis sp. H20-H5]|uniref:type VII secretion target n=1 Tax=Amycolatopsis sp. H20-H5 TaxID=3046309 RepID=UPI002DBE3C95|nr:type VII secretion target [Amycolatopsis sp. H20-H5]MEC3980721.1 type VII secretion target [Amycolatopsis sp. H20-H5]